MAKKSDITETVARDLATLFCSTAGLHLGIVRKDKAETAILKPEFFEAIVVDAKILLGKQWAESELKEKIYQAFRGRRQPARISDLVIGCVPAQLRRDPSRNLISGDDTRTHSEIRSVRMPSVNLVPTEDGFTLETVREAAFGESREVYTLDDLRFHWEQKLHDAGLTTREESDRIYGAFAWLLERYTLSEVLWGMDNFLKGATGDVRVLDLEPAISRDKNEQRGVLLCLG